MLKLVGIIKRFPGVIALNDVQFDVLPGEIHVLFGENGAGKSTLVNVMVGNIQPDAGDYTIDGHSALGLTPSGTRLIGLSAVFQEFSLAPALSVIDNLFLGLEPTKFGMLNHADMRMRAQAVFSEMKCSIPLDQPVSTLSRAQKQLTEIAKALIQKARILILDEPTASLADVEANTVIELVKALRDKGVGIVYISHRMREIRELADRVTVLRNGIHVGTIARDEISQERLVEMMTGRKIGDLFPKFDCPVGEVKLSVENLATTSGGVRDASIEVKAGEIVGLAGLVGCGKGRIGRALFGLEPIAVGTIKLDGKLVRPSSPTEMLARGLCYFPSDRVAEGLCLNRPIKENITMSGLRLGKISNGTILRRSNELSVAQSSADKFKLSPNNIAAKTEFLSGGNRQKVLLARGFLHDIDVYVFDEPTVGVDIGARTEIYNIIRDTALAGAAILIISSDLEEVVNMTTRLYVIHEGEVVADLRGRDKTEERVLECFFGNAGAENGAVSA